MYKKVIFNKTTIRVNNSTEGEMIELKVRRIMTNKEPIDEGAPIIYFDRKRGVVPETDIRDDKWERAAEGMTKVAQLNLVDREKRISERPDEIAKKEAEAAAKTKEGKA